MIYVLFKHIERVLVQILSLYEYVSVTIIYKKKSTSKYVQICQEYYMNANNTIKNTN